MTTRAQIEFENQLAYLHKRSPNGAKTWANKFKLKLNAIADDPKQFGVAPESDDHEQDIRQANFKTPKGNPYRIVFSFSEAEELVFIFSIRGLGQDYFDR